MTETESAPAAAPPAEAAAKKKPAKKASAGGAKKGIKKASGPAVSELLVQAVSASKERSGVSLAALKKVLSAGEDTMWTRTRAAMKIALKALVTKGKPSSRSKAMGLRIVQDQQEAARRRQGEAQETAPRRPPRVPRRPPSPPKKEGGQQIIHRSQEPQEAGRQETSKGCRQEGDQEAPRRAKLQPSRKKAPRVPLRPSRQLRRR
ncbi:unnamed protein product [Staurois parvus]|uniref:H15 domain-containing protein n=1 Tax=Staurois parvus TaxID=386267 RepID=A0ABN9ARP9_9NEOB|nr:unnamed protein product [Staurois parvus]